MVVHCEVSGHRGATVRKQEEVNRRLISLSPLFTFIQPGISGHEMVPSHLVGVWVFDQIKLSRNIQECIS